MVSCNGTIGTLSAADVKKAYFLSDLHLGARYLDQRESERRVVRFLDSIADDCAELYLLGDILDYWYEYRTVVPRGYVRFFGALARLSDAGVKITWLTGNHDIWLFDYLRDELGIRVVDANLEGIDVLGCSMFLTHGDRVGRVPAGFKILQHIFRNRVCQWLFAAVHPRWTVPLGYGWSKKNRGDMHMTTVEFDPQTYSGLIAWADAYSTAHPDVRYMVLGHYHMLADYALPSGARLIVLGEWIRRCSYGVFDGQTFNLLTFSD